MFRKSSRKLSDSAFVPERSVPHFRVPSDDHVRTELYDFQGCIGQGSFGKVIKARDRSDGSLWAVKRIEKQKPGSRGTRMLELEVKVLKRVNHKHIVCLHKVIESATFSFLVMELCVGGDLESRVRAKNGGPALATRTVMDVIAQLADAVSYLHSNDIVHRDLKPANVLLKTESVSNLDIQLSDFGLCGIKKKERQLDMMCGTPLYMAPEVLSDSGNYTPVCDLWSIGVIMYRLLFAEVPFDAPSADAMLAVIQPFKSSQLQCPASVRPEGAVGPMAEDLLRKLLTVDPARRITAGEVLVHPWITGLDSSQSDHDALLSTNVLDMMKQCANEDRQRRASVEQIPKPSESVESPLGLRRSQSVSEKRLPSNHATGGTSPKPTPLRKQASSPALAGYMRPTQASSGKTAGRSPSTGPRTVSEPAERDVLTFQLGARTAGGSSGGVTVVQAKRR
eukprot:m.73832 g.73832  ORF g.73832 m.73832 type:complete len:451 (+) comp14388_c0_seq1:1026-2378(+)